MYSYADLDGPAEREDEAQDGERGFVLGWDHRFIHAKETEGRALVEMMVRWQIRYRKGKTIFSLCVLSETRSRVITS